MKFTCTLRDEQSDQYSHWNKLHVAGHWTFQINCKKQNWNFFSFFFSYSPGGLGGGGAAAHWQDKTLNTKALQLSGILLASSNGILFPLQRNSTQPSVCNTPWGLTGTAWTIQPWPFAMQHSLLCLGYQQCHLQNNTTGKSSKSLSELTAPTPIPDLILWWKASVHEYTQIRELIWHKGEQAEGGITHSLTNPERRRSVRLIQSTYTD